MITIPRVFLQIQETSLPYSARVGRREKEEREDLVGVLLLTDGMIIKGNILQDPNTTISF